MDDSQSISQSGRGFTLWIRKGDSVIPKTSPYRGSSGNSESAAAGELGSTSTASGLTAKSFTLWTVANVLTSNTIASTYSDSSASSLAAAAAPPISLPGNGFSVWTRPATAPTTGAAPSPVPSAAPNAAPTLPTPQEGQSSLLPAVLVSIVLIPLLLILGAFTYQQINELNAKKDELKMRHTQYEALKTSATELKQQLAERDGSLRDTQAKVSTLNKSVIQAQKIAALTGSDLKAMTQDLAGQKDALAKAKAAITVGKELTSTLNERIGGLQKERDVATAKANVAREALDTLQSQSIEAAKALEAKASAAEAIVEQLTAEKAAMDEELSAAKSGIENLTQQVESLKKAAAESQADGATETQSDSSAEDTPLP